MIYVGNYLFFGCRYKEKDFLCCDEWKQYEKDSYLTIFVAFSRDQVRIVTSTYDCNQNPC